MRRIGAGIAGGLLAGALVGATEAIVVWRMGVPGATLPPLGWAIAAYGALGAVGGLVAGVAAGVLRTGGFGLGLGGVLAGLGFFAGRYRILHDVLLDRPPHGLVPALVEAGAIVVGVVVALLLASALRALDERRGLVTRPGFVAVLLALVALSGALAARVGATDDVPAPTGARGPANAPNVLLIVVDALRPDRLSCYGATTVKTPSLDALAADGTRWTHAFAQASSTRASMASIFSSLHPSSHGVIQPGDRLPDRVATLAESLAEGGWRTAGFANDADVSGAYGFGQGFAEYRTLPPERVLGADDAAATLALYGPLRVFHERHLARGVDANVYYRPAAYVVDRALQWLDQAPAETSYFLFLHFMDPHDPYVVHPENGVGYGRLLTPDPPAAMAETLGRAYDGEVAYVDAEIGRLVAELRRRGAYDRTLVVVTADHGEELHEHGGWWHGTTLYDEQLHVPLIAKPARDGARGRVVAELATSLDVAPTILRAAALTPPPAMQGLALPLDGAAMPARESVFAEERIDETTLRAVRTPTRKLITASDGTPRGAGHDELYDVASDPGETRNLAAAEVADREALRAELGRATLAARKGARADVAKATGQMSDETKRRLQELGYLDK
jgi:arylsulfatase A-like enzyme